MLLRELKQDGVIERKGQIFVFRQPDRLSAYPHLWSHHRRISKRTESVVSRVL